MIVVKCLITCTLIYILTIYQLWFYDALCSVDLYIDDLAALTVRCLVFRVSSLGKKGATFLEMGCDSDSPPTSPPPEQKKKKTNIYQQVRRIGRNALSDLTKPGPKTENNIGHSTMFRSCIHLFWRQSILHQYWALHQHHKPQRSNPFKFSTLFFFLRIISNKFINSVVITVSRFN